jgi:hypothetical protein
LFKALWEVPLVQISEALLIQLTQHHDLNNRVNRAACLSKFGGHITQECSELDAKVWI